MGVAQSKHSDMAVLLQALLQLTSGVVGVKQKFEGYCYQAKEEGACRKCGEKGNLQKDCTATNSTGN